jgi:hypothetical protein
MDDYVAKPVKPADLDTVLGRWSVQLQGMSGLSQSEPSR